MASVCPPAAAAVHAMVKSELEFAANAQASVRGAFLTYLAPDGLVLQPYPRLGVPLYQSAKEDKDRLAWYPTLAEIAASGDLGITSGPWTFIPADGGARGFGHFLTVWRRDGACAWHVELDAGVSHSDLAPTETPLTPSTAVFVPTSTPTAEMLAAEAYAHAIEDFQRVAQGDSVAAAFRTYGHNAVARLYIDTLPPVDGPGAVNEYLATHPVAGAWKEMGHGRSGDATLVYTTGEILDARSKPTHAYVQVWNYDPQVANWGLRLLLLSQLTSR